MTILAFFSTDIISKSEVSVKKKMLCEVNCSEERPKGGCRHGENTDMANIPDIQYLLIITGRLNK